MLFWLAFDVFAGVPSVVHGNNDLAVPVHGANLGALTVEERATLRVRHRVPHHWQLAHPDPVRGDRVLVTRTHGSVMGFDWKGLEVGIVEGGVVTSLGCHRGVPLPIGSVAWSASVRWADAAGVDQPVDLHGAQATVDVHSLTLNAAQPMDCPVNDAGTETLAPSNADAVVVQGRSTSEQFAATATDPRLDATGAAWERLRQRHDVPKGWYLASKRVRNNKVLVYRPVAPPLDRAFDGQTVWVVGPSWKGIEVGVVEDGKVTSVGTTYGTPLHTGVPRVSATIRWQGTASPKDHNRLSGVIWVDEDGRMITANPFGLGPVLAGAQDQTSGSAKPRRTQLTAAERAALRSRLALSHGWQLADANPVLGERVLVFRTADPHAQPSTYAYPGGHVWLRNASWAGVELGVVEDGVVTSIGCDQGVPIYLDLPLMFANIRWREPSMDARSPTVWVNDDLTIDGYDTEHCSARP